MDYATLARRLADRAEDVCATYLDNGRRSGNYWLVGDVFNTSGQSLYVRLTSAHGRRAGKWNDSATGEHGDLLDIIQHARNLTKPEARQEALRFLSEPLAPPRTLPAPRNSSLAANRLFHAAVPIIGTHGEAYLRARGITASLDVKALRYHPGCYYRPNAGQPLETRPAIIAAITDLDGKITGALRTYLHATEARKADVEFPRLAMGHLEGNGIRLGEARHLVAAGEGLETMLALRSLMPAMPMVAATSAGHLGSLILPATLKRFYIALDNDPAGRTAAERLILRHIDRDIRIYLLTPVLDDWNNDLIRFGPTDTAKNLCEQLAPPHRNSLLCPS